MPATVAIRMYNPGFGDCFRVTVHDGDTAWRLLVDCGVHSHGRAKVDGVSRTIEEVAAAVVADLAADCGGAPHLDVVVATHHHADHISGFACDAWDAVDVDEVWVSFVEDPSDPDAAALRDGTARVANGLQLAAERAAAARAPGRTAEAWPAALALAHDFAVNSSRNDAAMGRLTAGRFHGAAAHVRYLPDRDAAANTIPIGPDARVHVLGPSRDPADLARMNPPAADHWLAGSDGADSGTPGDAAIDDDDLFDALYRVPRAEVRERVGTEAMRARGALHLGDLAFDDEALLGAASLLERSVNNTSVFFVLEVSGRRFVFVGDSQEGAWDHVLDDPASLALVSAPLFYKVGHHGSHNATPKRFVEGALGDDAYAMVPVGFVKAWADTIPFTPLMAALADHRTHVLRADQPPAASQDGDVRISVDPAGMWSELAFSLA
jgi:beta-lactamase superfamily II metal-dependent hydrolase